MTQPLPHRLKESPSQTAGPYVHIGCTPNAAGLAMFEGDLGASLFRGEAPVDAIQLSGRVLDGMGAPVTDAMVELWQPDARGCFVGRDGADPDFMGFGRSACDGEGRFAFETVMPGPVPWIDGRMQAPHATLWIVARGINVGLHTRAYFDADATDTDPLLSRIQPRQRVETLLAREGEGGWTFDIRLQGKGETVFLDM